MDLLAVVGCDRMIRLVSRWEVYEHVTIWHFVKRLSLLTCKLFNDAHLERQLLHQVLMRVGLAHRQHELIQAYQITGAVTVDDRR